MVRGQVSPGSSTWLQQSSQSDSRWPSGRLTERRQERPDPQPCSAQTAGGKCPVATICGDARESGRLRSRCSRNAMLWMSPACSCDARFSKAGTAVPQVQHQAISGIWCPATEISKHKSAPSSRWRRCKSSQCPKALLRFAPGPRAEPITFVMFRNLCAGALVPDDPVPVAVVDRPEVRGEVHLPILAAFGLPAPLTP